MLKLIDTAVLMLGGEGKRLRSLTEKIPKPMLLLGEIPLLKLTVERLSADGIRKFYFNVNYLHKVIEDYFGDGSIFDVEIEYIREPFKMGTVGSLSLIKDINKPFLLMNGDIYTDIDFRDFFVNFRQLDPDIYICIRDYEISGRYGIIKTEGNYVTEWSEKPNFSTKINCGIYVLKPNIIDFIPKDHYYNMNHLVNNVLLKKGAVAYYKMKSEIIWVDIGIPEDYNNLLKIIKESKNGITS